MYLLLAAAIALIFAFALSAFYSMVSVFLIVLFVSWWILAFIVTASDDDNLVFCHGMEKFEDMKGEAEWWIFLLPFWMLMYAVVGGLVTAPIWFIMSNVNRKALKLVGLISTVVCLSILCAVGVILHISPLWVYKFIHYGWIIAAYIVLPVAAIAIVAGLEVTYSIPAKLARTMMAIAGVLVPLMIVGVVRSASATYELSTARDMHALANSPAGYDALFYLENDIDFTDEDVSWYGELDEFEAIFDGGGHTLRNMKVERTMDMISDMAQRLGFVGYNNGVIRKLNFQNCDFTITSQEFEHTYHNKYEIEFGILAGYNNGIITDCNLIDCRAKYTTPSNTAGKNNVYVNLTVGRVNDGGTSDKIENVYVTDNNAIKDDPFYVDSEGKISWIAVSKKAPGTN